MLTFDQFTQQTAAEGYTEFIERVWPPQAVLATHTHPFVIKALVSAGEMWLTMRGQTLYLKPGDWFELAFEEPHAERYGAVGATYWVARRV